MSRSDVRPALGTDARAALAIRLRLAVGDLAADRWRTLLALGSLLPLVVGYFVLAAVAHGLLAVAGDPPVTNNLLVTPVNVLDPMTGELDEHDLEVAAAAAGPEVIRASGLVMRASDVNGRIVQLRAAPPDTWAEVHGVRLLRGRLPVGDDDIAVTEGVTAATGWDVGDDAEIYGTGFRVTGIVSAPGTKFASLWMPLERAQRLFDTPDAYQIVVLTLRPDADPDAVADRVEAAPSLAGRAVAYHESAFADEAARLVRFASWLAYVAAALALVALAFGSFNLATVTLLERAREVGVLRVLGFGPRLVRGLVAARSVLLGLAAFLLGLALVLPYVATSPPIVLRTITLRPALTPWAVVGGALIVVAVTWSSAAVAARPALRRPPREQVARR